MGTEIKHVKIYTDGACAGNPGPGGWAAIIRYSNAEKLISGYDPAATNNRMELTAAIEALKILKERCHVMLYSDSSYLVNNFKNGWMDNWKINGWMNARKDPVMNSDLWRELDRLNSFHSIEWIKVKGHADNEENIRCDMLARDEIKKASKPSVQVAADIGDGKVPSSMPDNSPEPTLKRERTYEGSVIKVDKLEVMLPGGMKALRDVVVHPGASVIIPMDADGYVYLVRQFRKAVESYMLEMPAGKIDGDEKPEVCAERELYEETGLKAGKLSYITHIKTTPGFCNEVIHIFLASELIIGGEIHSDIDENLELEKIHICDLVKMVKNGGINDAKTMICIFIAEKVHQGEFIV